MEKLIHLPSMRNFIRRRRWRAYGLAGQKIISFQRNLAELDQGLWPDDAEYLRSKLDYWEKRRYILGLKLKGQ